MDDDLDDALSVPQIDEDQSSQVAAPVNPSHDSHFLTNMLQAQVTAVLSAL